MAALRCRVRGYAFCRRCISFLESLPLFWPAFHLAASAMRKDAASNAAQARPH
ncbi:hypothetical protein BC831DRAFT_442654, partial [Entophlyctis helioformis]